MVWRRLPTFFPNFPLRMMPLSEAQAAQIRETGWVREAAFRTEPHVNKVEIKRFLETVYGASVERVSTLNYEGKKKRRLDPRTGRPRWVRLPDWKKAYVVFRPRPEDADRAAAAAGGATVAEGGAAEGAGTAAARAEAQQQQQGQRGQRRAGGAAGPTWLPGGYPGRLAQGGWPRVPPGGSWPSSLFSGQRRPRGGRL